MNKDSSIAKNLSVMTISVGLTQVIALALKMLMPRIFGPEKMGIFFFAESYAALFFAFLPLGLSTYISRTLPPRPDHVKDVLWTILWAQAAVAVVIMLAMFGSLVWQGREWETIIVTLLMGGFSAIFAFQRDIFQRIFIILGDVVHVSKLNVMVKVILVSGSMLILFTMPSIAWIAFMHLFSEAIGLFILIRKAVRSKFIQVSRKAPYLWPMLKISFPFYFAGVIIQAFGQIDIFMLSRYAGAVEVGYFGSAYKIIAITLFLIPVVQNTITPVLSRSLAEDKTKFTDMLKECIRLLMVASLPLSVGLTVFGDLVSALLNGPEFAPGFRTVAFLTPILIMMYVNVLVCGGLYLASDGKKLPFVFVIGGILNVALDYYSIPYGLAHFGPGGGGLAVTFATFFCEIFVCVGMLIMLPQKILSARMVYNLLLVFIPCWLGMYFHDEVMALNFWQRILVFLLFIPYGFSTRLMTMKDVALIKELIPARFRRV